MDNIEKNMNLKEHEKIVIDQLVSGVVPSHILSDIKSNPQISDYNVTGNGYFLTIKHPELSKERIVCDTHILIGNSDGIETGFIIFIEGKELTIECHGWGDKSIPEDYRNQNVIIRSEGLWTDKDIGKK